jgi:hypothetical protein
MSTAHHDEKFAKMSFSKVYPLYLTKIQKKGRSEAELLSVLTWLTGYSEASLRLVSMQSSITFQDFFSQPECKMNPNASLITGTICGYRVQDIVNPLTQKVRWMDKLVDELAMGKSLDKICRSESTPLTDAAAPGMFVKDKKGDAPTKVKTVKRGAVVVKTSKAKPKKLNGVMAKKNK